MVLKWKFKNAKATAFVDPMSSRVKILQTSLVQSATNGNLFHNAVLINVSREKGNLLDRACFGKLVSRIDTDFFKYELSLEEGFYMHHQLKCIDIMGEDNKSKHDDEVWECMKLKNKRFSELYTAYSYFRSKNWVVRQGNQYGVDFVVYRHHPELIHSEYVVIVSCESKGFKNRLTLWSDVYCTARLSISVAKILVDFHITRIGNNPLFPSCLEECKIKMHVITRFQLGQCHHNGPLKTDSSRLLYPNQRQYSSMLQLGFFRGLGLVKRVKVLKWLAICFNAILQFLGAFSVFPFWHSLLTTRISRCLALPPKLAHLPLGAFGGFQIPRDLSASRNNISKARWDAKMCLAEIIKNKGRPWKRLGIVRKGKLYCSIEEILYLTERGAVHLFDANDSIVAKLVMYDMIGERNNGCCWESFEAYMHLKSMGYVVGRHGVSWSMKTNENIGVVQRDLVENATLVGDMHINNLKPVFDVYNPTSKFKKSSPGDPSFILCLTDRFRTPSYKELDDLLGECNGTPLGLCHTNHGRISIFFFNEMEQPLPLQL